MWARMFLDTILENFIVTEGYSLNSGQTKSRGGSLSVYNMAIGKLLSCNVLNTTLYVSRCHLSLSYH